MAAYIIGMQMRRGARVVIEVIHAAGNDVNPPGLATTETLTQHVNLNYFSEAVSSESKLGWRMPIPGGSRATGSSQCQLTLTGVAVEKLPLSEFAEISSR